MRTIWSPQALRDLGEIRAYIGAADPGAARRAVLRITGLVESQLPSDPESGRPGRVNGTRELVVAGTPFIVPYRLKGDRIEILRVYHAARRWPERF